MSSSKPNVCMDVEQCPDWLCYDVQPLVHGCSEKSNSEANDAYAQNAPESSPGTGGCSQESNPNGSPMHRTQVEQTLGDEDRDSTCPDLRDRSGDTLGLNQAASTPNLTRDPAASRLSAVVLPAGPGHLHSVGKPDHYSAELTTSSESFAKGPDMSDKATETLTLPSQAL